MGRGGGGGGGGSGGGGGHSSGGFSGGGHSYSGGGRGGSFSSRSSRSSSGSGYHSSTHFHTHVGGGYSARRCYTPTGPVYRRRSSISGMVFTLIMFLILVAVLCAYAVHPSGSSIQMSSVDREPLPSTSYSLINDWVQDDWDWLGTAKSTTDGLRYFQKETGVQIYAVVTDNVGVRNPSNADVGRYAEQVYTDVFGDDYGHAVFVWYEGPTSTPGQGDGRYETYICVGSAATPVLDDEAVEIVLDYFDSCYANSSYNEDELLGATFEKAADRMMTKTPNYGFMLLIAAIALCGVIFVFLIIRSIHRRKKEEAEETERILNTPIDQL